MSGAGLCRPRLGLPFTIVADRDTVHLIAGEDMRYSIRAGEIAEQFAHLLRRCDGCRSLESLLDVFSDGQRMAAMELIERLDGERIMLEGPVEAFHSPDHYSAVVEGDGPLIDRLVCKDTDAKPIAVFCQQSLDYHSAMEFNRRCLRGGDSPWLWVTTGPASRGYVSPVFLPDAGPCLACLLRHFQRLSPVPQLYDAMAHHGETGGDFAAVPFPDEAMTILEQIATWKIRQMSVTPAPSALFRLHVLELETMQVSLHRVFLDPTCPDCQDARLV
jgi:bacteriocin biosynthesis cyclodehydratase domain-containing protein